jgi:flagellar hook-associated protein 1 FlgK
MSVNLASIGMSGISAAEVGIAAIESNITNASNPNYSAESVNLAVRAGPQGEGTGVTVLGTVRSEAPFLATEINSTSSSQSYNAAFSGVATLAQQIVAPGAGVNLSQALQSLFNAFANLSAQPVDATVRASAINAAAQFAQVDRNISLNLGGAVADQRAQISKIVTQVNEISGQIAQLNAQIVTAEANGQNGGALKDQRDALIIQLANLIGASADSNGNVSVGGVPLVSGSSALTLSTTGAGPALGLQVVLSKGALQVQLGQIGGKLGGVFAGIASVEQVQTQIDAFATSVATAVNGQHQAGFGLDGSTGNPLFLISGLGGPIGINPAINTQNLAASATAAGLPGDGSNATAIAALAKSVGVDVAYPSSTLGQAFGQLESDFGTTVQNAANNQQQAAASLQSLTQLKGSITGVSLNDQLTHLIQFQNLLQATARALQTANDLTTFLIQEL